jgi:hypothetical protein
MAINKPYYLTVRQFNDGEYSEGGRSRYIEHPKYSHKPSRFIRGFELLQEDLLTLFEYVEPSKLNNATYSLRIFELLLRVCTEIEANFKYIMKMNTYTKKSEKWWDIEDYFKINASHFLSDYLVLMPSFWEGTEKEKQPFKDWGGEGTYKKLIWYDAYNQAKHNRVDNLSLASFENLTNAFCGLVVVLTAQFLDNDFMSKARAITDEGPNDGYEDAIGGYFRVKLPTKIPDKERYDFNWQDLMNLVDPFDKFDYDSI